MGTGPPASNASSCRRIASSSAASSGPGSIPSCSASTRLTRRTVRSASVCRPAWYWASASSCHRRSRRGAALTMASAVASTSRCRPVRSEASTRNSSASRRSSSSRSASMAARSDAFEVLEWRAAPQTERFAEEVRRAFGLAERQQFAAPDDQALKPPGVQVVGWDGQHVALRGGADHVAAERPTDPEHTALERLVRRARRLLTPHGLGQPVLRHRLTDADRQGRQDRSVPSPEGHAVIADHGPQHADAHAANCPRTSGLRQRQRNHRRTGPAEGLPQKNHGRTARCNNGSRADALDQGGVAVNRSQARALTSFGKAFS